MIGTSDHKEYEYRRSRLQEERCIEIDRERSLKLVSLAERGGSKQKSSRSNTKSQFCGSDRMRSQKIAIIHQIEEKLAFKEGVDFPLGKQTNNANTDALHHRVFRLEKLMGQIKKERTMTDQPKTVFMRQKVQPNRVNVNEIVQKKVHYVESKQKTNLQLILKEIHQVRQEVKTIQQKNEQILTQGQSRIFSAQINSEGYEKFKKTKESDMFSRFSREQFNPTVQVQPFGLKQGSQNKPGNMEMELRDTLINDLQSVMPPSHHNIKDSFGSEDVRISQPYLLENDQNPQLSYPSQVLYSWKPQLTDPNLHPSRVASSDPVHRIIGQGAMIRN